MKRRLQRGLALLLTLCLLSGNLAFAEELPAQSAETSISEEAPAQNEETLPRENETEVPEENEAEAPEENETEVPEANEENAPAEDEGELEVAPEHTPEALREGAPEEGSYLLDLHIRRHGSSIYDNVTAAYMKRWGYETPSPIFDWEEFSFIKFDVQHHLEIDWTGEMITQRMHGIPDGMDLKWEGDIYFKDIEVPYRELKIDYYVYEGDEWVDPAEMEYDLTLSKGEDGILVLDVPLLRPNGDNVELTGDEHLLEVEYRFKDPAIYVGGASANDDHDGQKPDTAVETFAKARELAEKNPKFKEIVVLGELEVEGDLSLKNTDAKLVRGENYKGYLLSIPRGKTATLSDIVIDGNSERNETIEKSLISVNEKAILNIQTGTVLRNNKIKKGSAQGGAIYAKGAEVNMTDGLVEENRAYDGGGICLDASTMNFSGGTVQKNAAQDADGTSAAGGGILATGGSTIHFSKDAKVLGNTSATIGGGISLGTRTADQENTLYMTGGTIDGNMAEATGGGIFIQAHLNEAGSGYNRSVAHISGGKIINNRVNDTGKSENAFGGGGIYVNGVSPHYGKNGELYLQNAIITKNESELQGAGFAGCPVTDTVFHVNDGVAIYNNKITGDTYAGQGNTVYITSLPNFGSLHTGNAKYKLSPRMLGGAPYDWIKYTRDGLIPLPQGEYEGTLSSDKSLRLNSNDKANALTEVLGTVIISGNSSATKGGGIGSNGTVIFGTEGKTIDIPVEKRWKDKNDVKKLRPESITVELIAIYDDTEYVIDTCVLSEANEWKTVFKELPTKNAGKPITYEVKEIAVTGYDSKITWSADKGFVITNTPETPPPTPREKTVEIPVEKIWKDEGHEDKRPTEITVTLYADGVATEKTLVLSATNEWKGVFRNLPEKKDGKIITYTVKEVEVKGYESVRTGNQHDGFTLTNTYKPEKPPTPPTPPKPPIPAIPFVRIPRAGA